MAQLPNSVHKWNFLNSKPQNSDVLLFDEGSQFRKRSDEQIFIIVRRFIRFITGGRKIGLEPRVIDFLYRLRKHKVMTKLLGTVNRVNYRRIEIDLTYQCNLKCFNCDRSCAQAPSDISMTPQQIQKFIDESIAQERTWEEIHLLGGEPTLHPQLNEIIEMLLAYKHAYSPQTLIRLISNGFGPQVQEVLDRINPEIVILNTSKQTQQQGFHAYNMAPIDQKEYRHVAFTNGCPIIVNCGLNLNPHGYYPCGPGGSIDRVFGFDIGRKKLPDVNDRMLDQLDMLERYCGHFRWDIYNQQKTPVCSLSWEKAYARMRTNPPCLTRY